MLNLLQPEKDQSVALLFCKIQGCHGVGPPLAKQRPLPGLYPNLCHLCFCLKDSHLFNVQSHSSYGNQVKLSPLLGRHEEEGLL